MNLKQKFYDQIPEKVELQGYNPEKIHFILRSVGSNKRVLDVGCNDGYIGSKLLRNKNDVFGIDIAQRKVNIAKKRGIKSQRVDIENQDFPFAADSFDVVLLTDVIEHVFDTDALLSKIYRVLKKGGRLFITTPNVASLGRRIMLLFGINPFLEYSTHYIDYVPLPVGHIRYYTHKDLQRQLIRNKFRDVTTVGDRVNFILFSSSFIARIFPFLSVDIHCECKK